MTQLEHLLEKQDKTWVCKICGLTWKRKPKRKCEGIPAIRYDELPKGAIWDFNARIFLRGIIIVNWLNLLGEFCEIWGVCWL